jgi:hypothetical protein
MQETRLRLHASILFAALVTGAAGPALAVQIATFDDLGLGAESEYHGEDGAGDFVSGSATFTNSFDPTYGTWDGFAASTITDNSSPGFDNQFSAIAGGGEGGSAGYGVGFWSSFALDDPSIVFETQQTAVGVYITNSTYAYISMRDGDPFAKKFGGATGTDEDWFLLTIDGYDNSGVLTETLEFYLADFRYSDSADDYLIDDWTYVDLTGLGSVKSIDFSLSSSDVGIFGMNTPSYFALDTLLHLPEPSAGALVGLGLAGLLGWRRR